MLIAHRIALDPTDKQRTYFARASGVARFAWNWALAEWQRQYAARRDDPSLPQPSDAALRRQLNSLVPDTLLLEPGIAAPLLEERPEAFYGATVVVADRWFPSSKTCSCCGSVKAELALSQRTYHCDKPNSNLAASL